MQTWKLFAVLGGRFSGDITGWTARQVVHHCADDHRNCYVRFKLALTEDAPARNGYEEALGDLSPAGRPGLLSQQRRTAPGLTPEGSVRAFEFLMPTHERYNSFTLPSNSLAISSASFSAPNLIGRPMVTFTAP
jgi:hypothetical protein